jgi:hypothetical protein
MGTEEIVNRSLFYNANREDSVLGNYDLHPHFILQ